MCSSLFGFIWDGGAVISSSGCISSHGVKLKGDFKWIRTFGDVNLGLQGDISDCEFVFSAIDNLLRQNNNQKLAVVSVANACRTIIAENLRQSRLRVNGIVAGLKLSSDNPELYWFDSSGALQKVEQAVHGEDFMAIQSQIDHQKFLAFNKEDCSEVNSEGSNKKRLPKFGKMGLDNVKKVIDCCWQSATKRGILSKGSISTLAATSEGIIAL